MYRIRGAYLWHESARRCIDLLREYCFNVNIYVMYRWVWEGVGIWKLLPRRSGATEPPLGRRRGIKSEREMMYPSITPRVEVPLSTFPRLLSGNLRTLLVHNSKQFYCVIALLSVDGLGCCRIPTLNSFFHIFSLYNIAVYNGYFYRS